MNEIKIAISSIVPDNKNYNYNYNVLMEIVENNKDKDIVCFQELYLYSDYTNINDKIINDLEIIHKGIRELSIKLNVAVSYGTIVKSFGKIYIGHIVSTPKGEEYVYKKMVLGSREKLVFDCSDKLCLFEYMGFKFGVLLCIETHLPELSYIYRMNGARIMLCPFRMPGDSKRRLEIWEKYIPARSYDYNTVHILNNYYGGIMAVDGKGDIILSDFGKGVYTIEINRSHFNEKLDYHMYSRKDIIGKYLIGD